LTIATTTDAAPHARRHRALFLATICTGSLLLFLVQPMIARMALPRLGGAPAVWNSAMLVYQALLLAGYAYAHWLGRFAARQQAMIHLAIFAIAALTLPIALSDTSPSADVHPVVWVPWLLLTSIGPLFFVVSAQAPLLQRWFTLSGGENPYPLYAASNLGSFVGLLAYPLAVEPLLKTGDQSLLWSVGYVVVAVLSALCALCLPRTGAEASAQAPTTPVPGWNLTLRWIALAAIASGLMLSTSLHLTTDIAAMPLLWVIPLGLYLLSFTVAFSTNRELHALIVKLALLSLLLSSLTTFIGSVAPHSAVLLVAGNFFIIATALHARMFELRPAAEHLTRFYLAMSVGGVIGGIFCALLAPVIFDWTYEHPILLIAAAFAIGHRPLFAATEKIWAETRQSKLSEFATIAVLLAVSLLVGGVFFKMPYVAQIFIALIMAIFAALCCGRRWLFAGALVATMLSAGGWKIVGQSLNTGQMTRSYFGVYSLKPIDGKAMSLYHGTTIHGVQMLDPKQALIPPGYYTPTSGVGLAMQAVPKIFGDKARIGVIGLGTGALVCYSRPGETWTFYEIDPAIESIARDPKKFSFVSRCRPDLRVIIGDARLAIADEPPASADVLIIDAFSSDAIPVHLLTEEAFATYRRYLAPGGLLVIHISNKFLGLSPVISTAADPGWVARIRTTSRAEPSDGDVLFFSSTWAVMSEDPAKIETLERVSGAGVWSPIEKAPDFERWKDNYSSVLPLLIARFKNN
jgi:SAM-dependent methyltransferase